VRKYEGLFILNTAGREDSVTEMVDRVSDAITKLGVKIETVQKMEKKPFSRVADKKVKDGFYVNYIFEAEPAVAAKLPNHFDLDDEVFRVMVTLSPQVKAA
jgi:ribosomal protein S6